MNPNVCEIEWMEKNMPALKLGIQNADFYLGLKH